MALQDLTPQLRTRLSRMERTVGWFVIVAVAALVFGFGYYVYNTAARKGWFLTKAPYFIFVNSANGLKVGDPVMLMGFDAGTITEITPMPAEQFDYNVFVEFVLKSPNFGYIWTEGSRAKVATADLLGKRVLEVTKGTGGYPTFLRYPLRTNLSLAVIQSLPDLPRWALAQDLYDRSETNLVAHALWPLTNLALITASGQDHFSVVDTRQKTRSLTAIWEPKQSRYEPFTNHVSKYWLLTDESPAITEQAQQLVAQVQAALPGIFNLTNQLSEVLSNSAHLTANLNVIALSARPAVSNIAAATAQLDRPGALGEWLIPTNINRQLEGTLGTANTTLASANTNLTALVENLNRSLDNLAGITSNLNQQVEANTNLVGAIDQAIVHADQFVQGLKHHWLFRSAFKTKATNAPPAVPPHKLRSPKAKGQ